MNNKRMAKSRT